MKEGDLIIDGDNRMGVITSIILAYVPLHNSAITDGASVLFVYYFKDQKEEVAYADEITVLKQGEKNGTHFLEQRR